MYVSVLGKALKRRPKHKTVYRLTGPKGYHAQDNVDVVADMNTVFVPYPVGEDHPRFISNRERTSAADHIKVNGWICRYL